MGFLHIEECLSLICSPPFSGFILYQFYLQAEHSTQNQTCSLQILLQLSHPLSGEMESSSWQAIKTIPNNDFEQSLQLMNDNQIGINIIEINLLAIKSKTILEWLVNQHHKYQFYLKYRYVLENVLNGKLSDNTQKSLSIATAKFDESFINGPTEVCYSEKIIFDMPFQKESKLKFIEDQGKIINLLDQISLQLYKIDDHTQKRALFNQKLTEINTILKVNEQELTKQEHSPKDLRGFVFYLGNTLKKLVAIDIKKSYFILTKNRNPLVLDFEFARFLYKNDDQLSHEIISMEFIKYFNTILGKEYIVPYQIIPFKIGALYQFVDNAATIHQIKAQYEHGLVQFYQEKCKEHSFDKIMNRFAESYSGFCLIQYMLDIKDRNNANIMIKDDGSIFHIDLTFIFCSGPGGMSFESAPFKLTKEYLTVLGGFESDIFRKFQSLMVQHFTKLLQFKQELIKKLNILSSKHRSIRCFKNFSLDSFCKKLPKKQSKVKQFVQDLMDSSFDSWKTTKYDDFQFKSNHILK